MLPPNSMAGLDLLDPGGADAEGEEPAAAEQRHRHQERVLSRRQSEPQAGGLADERQRERR